MNEAHVEVSAVFPYGWTVRVLQRAARGYREAWKRVVMTERERTEAMRVAVRLRRRMMKR